MKEGVILPRPAVYRIVNNATGKVYVGSTMNAKNRKRRHFADLRAGIHHSVYLQRSWDKHGAENFAFEIVEYVDDPSWLIFVEQSYLDAISKAGIQYNVCSQAGNCLGVKQSDETIQKRANALRGRIVSDATKQAISKAKKGRCTDKMAAASKEAGLKKRFELSAIEASFYLDANKRGISATKLAAMIPVNHHAFYRAMRAHYPDFHSPVKGGRPYAT